MKQDVFNMKSRVLTYLALIPSLFFATLLFAASYSYLTEGDDFDIVGMFDCDLPDVGDCRETDVYNYMFMVDGGLGDGISISQGPRVKLYTFWAAGNSLHIEDEGQTVEIEIADYGAILKPQITAWHSHTILEKPNSSVPIPSTFLLFALSFLAFVVWHHRAEARSYPRNR